MGQTMVGVTTCVGSAAPSMPERPAITTGSQEGVLDVSWPHVSIGEVDECYRNALA